MRLKVGNSKNADRQKEDVTSLILHFWCSILYLDAALRDCPAWLRHDTLKNINHCQPYLHFHDSQKKNSRTQLSTKPTESRENRKYLLIETDTDNTH